MSITEAVPTTGRTICEECEGEGCETCDGSGHLVVGVFDPICARHCHLCEGQDHHWSYEGGEDENGESVMACRHCTARRYFTDEDDAAADY